MGNGNKLDWGRALEVFEQALDREPGDRSGWIERSCEGDDALRGCVQSLLAGHRRQDGLLDRPLDTLSLGGAGGEMEVAADSDELVGPYRVLGELGRGGMGVVYKAEDPRLGRNIALKFLPPYLMSDEQAKQRLIVEARAASQLDHPNICTIHDIGETGDGRLYFAMACYDGEDLASRIERGPLPVEQAVDIAAQIAGGLAHAHAAGVVHRDVKPSNILITPGGEIKILDFGLAKMDVTTISEPGTRLGTMLYMSPELALGSDVDHRTDLWALGVTLYEMLTGRLPFTGDSHPAVLYQIVHADPEPLPSSTPGWLTDIVNRLLSKTREHRFDSAKELADALTAKREDTALPADEPRLRNLPDYLTSFVGRTKEVGETTRLLQRTRLLTLSGPGGAGKTRLSVTIARAAAGSFRHGVCFVPLAAIDDASLVAPAIARALNIPESPGGSVMDQLKVHLAHRELLLLLDNFEQVLDAAPVAMELLGACPRLKVMVTSRAALRFGGEQEYPVPPLEAPGPSETMPLQTVSEHPAIRLFVERANAARPDFELTADNARDVAALCRSLDGMPLAIELAAARIRLFTPKALLARLGKRLDLLTAGSRDLPARHRTLRQAIAWSHDLLDDRSRRFFRRLAVFSGGWTLEACAALCQSDEDLGADPVDLLSSLTDQSLVRQIEGAGGEPRFSMLETIRAFAREQLEAAGELESRSAEHARWFLAFAEKAESELTGADQVLWLDRLESEHDNLRSVFSRAQQNGDADTGVRLGAALWRFWIARGYIHEGLPRLEALLGLPAAAGSIARGRALNGLATLCHYQCEYSKALVLLEDCLAQARRHNDEESAALALNNLGWIYCWLSDFKPARAFSEEALALNMRLGQKRGAALSLNNLGWVAAMLGESSAASSYFTCSLALRREISDQRGIGFALTNLSWAKQLHGDLDRADALLDEAQEVLRPVDDRILKSLIHVNRGRVARSRGESDKAVRELELGLGLWSSGTRSVPSLKAMTQLVLGGVLHEMGETKRSADLLAIAIRHWRESSCPWGVAATLLAQARALAHSDAARAEAMTHESLEIVLGFGGRLGVAECLELLAELALKRGDAEAAAVNISAAARIRSAVEVPLSKPARERVEAQLARIRDILAPEAYSRAWERGQTLTPEESGQKV